MRISGCVTIAACSVALLATAQGCGGGAAIPGGSLPTPMPSPMSLYAGNCPSGGLPPTVAAFPAPVGLATAPGFVTPPIPGGSCVGGITIANEFTLIAATGTAGTAFFDLPITGSSTPVYVIPASRPNPTFVNSVAVDGTGALYVADAESGTISVYVPPLLSATAPAFQITGVNQPAQLSFDAGGSLFVAACGSNQIVRFDPPFSPTSVPSLAIAVPGASQCPHGIAFDARGDLLVAARNVNALYSFTPPFSSTSQPSYSIVGAFTMLAAPESLAIDNSGRLFVSNGSGSSSGILVFLPPFSANSIPANLLQGVTTPTGLTVGP
jgi:streptogramin lyase